MQYYYSPGAYTGIDRGGVSTFLPLPFPSIPLSSLSPLPYPFSSLPLPSLPVPLEVWSP